MRKPVRVIQLEVVEPKILGSVLPVASKSLGVSMQIGGPIHCDAGLDRKRGQYRADAIIQDCLKRYLAQEKFTLGLTGRDLYMPGLNFVFGLALKPLSAAVVSWNRLTAESIDITATRLAKEIVHEVGHLEGLDHCANPMCVMWFSNTLRETDRKGSEFCGSCRSKLS